MARKNESRRSEKRKRRRFMAEPSPEQRCGTCGWWRPGLLGRGIVGNCEAELEGTTFDKICPINMWRPREDSTVNQVEKKKIK